MSKAGDPRLFDLLSSSKNESGEGKMKVGILGYPCDIGVKRNNGRPGAKRGPDVVRNRLPKLGPLVNPEFEIDLRAKLCLEDRGNVDVTSNSLEQIHDILTERVENILKEKDVLIVVGGGNDQSYCNVRGLMNALKSGEVGVVNIDAHLDVRPLLDGNRAHSGSPFRQLLTDSEFRKDGAGKFVEFAIQGNQSSAEHAQFVRDCGGDVIFLSQVKKHSGGAQKKLETVLKSFGAKREVFVSFDIDSIEGAYCPGVSCPAVIGLTAQDALDICFTAGQHPNTRLLDLSEFNPDIEEYRTGTLVCNMIYYFLMGIASR